MNKRFFRSLVQAVAIVLGVACATNVSPPSFAAQPNNPDAGHPTIRFYSPPELLGVQQSVFETLFLQPWDAEHWEYPLDAEVNGRGIYLGTNQYGQPFELHVKVFAPVDVQRAGLPAAHLQWARDSELVYACVIGELVHQDTRVRVHGRVISTRSAEERRSPASGWPTSSAPSINSRRFLSPISFGALSSVRSGLSARRVIRSDRTTGATALRTAPPSVTWPSRPRTITSTRRLRRRGRSATRTMSRRTRRTRLLFKTRNKPGRTISPHAAPPCILCDAGCALLFPAGGAGAIVCIASCTATHALCAAGVEADYDRAVQTASENRVTTLHTADKVFNLTYDAQTTIRDNNIDLANATYAACTRGCPGQPGGGGPQPQVFPED